MKLKCKMQLKIVGMVMLLCLMFSYTGLECDAACIKGNGMESSTGNTDVIVLSSTKVKSKKTTKKSKSTKAANKKSKSTKSKKTKSKKKKSSITQDIAYKGVKNYIDSTGYEWEDDYTNYLDIEDASEQSFMEGKDAENYYLIHLRAYTGAHNYFYVNKKTGYTIVTEYVPGIEDDETDTGTTFNVLDYSKGK